MKNHKIIEFLKWDSDFFGFKVGKILLTKDGFEESSFIDEKNKEHYDLIYGFSSSDITPYGFWESLGFYLADTSVVLSMKFDPARHKNSRYECCTYLSKNDINACYEIAEMVAPVSRFYREPAVGKELTKKMFRKWIDTALDGSFSDYLFVERIENNIVGIHAIKTEGNAGAVTLIGARDGFHGKGIGRRLWEQSFGYWANKAPRVNLIKTRFSMNNKPAFGFYGAVGLSTVESTHYIYHYSREHERV